MKPNSGLTIQVTDPAEVRRWVEERTHWIIVFVAGWTAMQDVDALDRAIGRYPTFATLIGPGLIPVTIIPKRDLTRAQLKRAIRRVARARQGWPPGKDVLIITPGSTMSGQEAHDRANAVLGWLAQDPWAPPLAGMQPCGGVH